MTSATLASRAASMARPSGEEQAQYVPPAEPEAPAVGEVEFDEEAPLDYPVPEQVPVHVAWHRVMCDITHIAKTRKVAEGKLKYSFRGVEDVVQAFAASLRRHGVIVAPSEVRTTYTSSSSRGGTTMRECTVVIKWKVLGPTGEELPIPLESAGEAMDYQDKSTTKAQSIALRTFLTTLGMVPTGDPEPEAESAEIERGEPGVSPGAYLAEITNPYTARERFREIWNEMGRHGLLTAVVEHDGDRGELGALYRKIGSERWPKPKPAAVEHSGPHDDSGFNPECAGCETESAAADRKAAAS